MKVEEPPHNRWSEEVLVLAFWQRPDSVRLWAANFSCLIPRFNNKTALSSDHGFLRAGEDVSRTEDRFWQAFERAAGSCFLGTELRLIPISSFAFPSAVWEDQKKK